MNNKRIILIKESYCSYEGTQDLISYERKRKIKNNNNDYIVLTFIFYSMCILLFIIFFIPGIIYEKIVELKYKYEKKYNDTK